MNTLVFYIMLMGAWILGFSCAHKDINSSEFLRTSYEEYCFENKGCPEYEEWLKGVKE